MNVHGLWEVPWERIVSLFLAEFKLQILVLIRAKPGIMCETWYQKDPTFSLFSLHPTPILKSQIQKIINLKHHNFSYTTAILKLIVPIDQELSIV